MKVGLSSLVCPAWDLTTIVERAADLGFDGIELRGIRGELNLLLVPELAGRPEQVRGLLSERGVELVCLGCSATLDSLDRRVRAEQRAIIAEYLELAGKLGCPFVRVFVGEVQRRDNLRSAQSRIAEGLASLVPIAARYGVTVLVENGGDFPTSDVLWFLVDAVGHPYVQCCWNQCHAKTAGERPTISIPRLGQKLGLVHVCDAAFDDQGFLLEYRPIGEGDAEIAKQIELLKGVAYDGYLVFEWPKLWDDSLPAAETVLPPVISYLRERIVDKQEVLTAYKGDKRPTRFAPRPKVGSAGG